MTTRAIHRGKYRLIAEIGRGGMAEVYLALLEGDMGFNKLVVLKQIRDDMSEDPELLEMFIDEARLAARLRHPNVVETNEVAQEDGHTFMAMEYLEGQPLHRIFQRVHRIGGLALSVHLRILADMLAGLHHAHQLCDWDGTQLGVVHRDVSPQNVFVTYTGLVKVVDFGIAKVKNAQAHTRAGIVKGKIAYLAPEQARREDLDRRVDIFAAGVMLWEAVTKTRPWKGRSEQYILERLMAGEFPAAIAANPEIPPELVAILAKALAPERQDRYSTAAQFQAAIEAYMETLDERVDMRDLGKLLSEQFADDRQVIRARLDDALLVDPLEVHASTGSLPRLGERQSVPSIDRTAAPGTPARIAAAAAAGGVATIDRTGSAAVSLPAIVSAAAPRSSGRVRPALAIGLLAAAAFTVSLWAPWRATPVAVAVASAVAAPTDSAPAAVDRVALNVRALPADTRIFLDGAPLANNPYAGVLAADGATHQLRIEAPGFITRTQAIKLDKDALLEFSLAAAEPSADLPGASPTRKGPLPGGFEGTTGKGRRSLDVRNPYEH
jgi:serine/threonine-protein kinase